MGAMNRVQEGSRRADTSAICCQLRVHLRQTDLSDISFSGLLLGSSVKEVKLGIFQFPKPKQIGAERDIIDGDHKLTAPLLLSVSYCCQSRQCNCHFLSLQWNISFSEGGDCGLPNQHAVSWRCIYVSDFIFQPKQDMKH